MTKETSAISEAQKLEDLKKGIRETMEGIEREEAYFQYQFLPALMKKLPEEKVKEIYCAELKRQLKRIEDMEAQLYTRNDVLRAKGEPFHVRHDWMTRRRALIVDARLRKEFLLRYMKCIPLDEWLTPHDMSTIMRMGVQKFLVLFGLQTEMGIKVPPEYSAYAKGGMLLTDKSTDHGKH